MGILTENDVRPNITYIAFDTKSGQLTSQGELISGVSGKLLGFDEHTFNYEGIDNQKFDIVLEDAGKIYQLQFGKHTWTAYMIMNSLHSLDLSDPETLKQGILRIVGYQKDGKNRMYITFNGERLSWKYTAEDMKLPEDKDKRNERKNVLCDHMFGVLFEALPCDAKQVSESLQTDEQQKEVVTADNNEAVTTDDDDSLPF